MGLHSHVAPHFARIDEQNPHQSIKITLYNGLDPIGYKTELSGQLCYWFKDQKWPLQI